MESDTACCGENSTTRRRHRSEVKIRSQHASNNFHADNIRCFINLSFWKPFVTLSLSGRVHIKNNYLHLNKFRKQRYKRIFFPFQIPQKISIESLLETGKSTVRCRFKDWRWCCSNGFYECVPRSCFGVLMDFPSSDVGGNSNGSFFVIRLHE